ncbi:hypothetical protein LX36DRAFT_128692 [Colletotrichum falcatum]|nr:hypothetical protein LX36DRAFT_128692 [Colletotrichum falcatum]
MRKGQCFHEALLYFVLFLFLFFKSPSWWESAVAALLPMPDCSLLHVLHVSSSYLPHPPQAATYRATWRCSHGSSLPCRWTALHTLRYYARTPQASQSTRWRGGTLVGATAASIGKRLVGRWFPAVHIIRLANTIVTPLIVHMACHVRYPRCDPCSIQALGQTSMAR